MPIFFNFLLQFSPIHPTKLQNRMHLQGAISGSIILNGLFVEHTYITVRVPKRKYIFVIQTFICRFPRRLRTINIFIQLFPRHILGALAHKTSAGRAVII